MRQKINLLSLDVDSALALMQEIYNDIVEQKSTASLITKKMLTFMKDAEDMSVIGPVIKDQQKILNDCTEKKISLVKLQGVLLKQSGGPGKEGFSKMALSEDDKAILQKMVDDIDKEKDNGDTYEIK
jgi:hypothetical protein